MYSIGVDIGTSTTAIIISKISISTKLGPSLLPVTSIDAVDIIYRSPVSFTPFLSHNFIDFNEIREKVHTSILESGISIEEIGTGAVIITGETARKENSAEVSNSLSEYLGDFVVATAGPKLESVLAGRGSGICEESKKRNRKIINLDIGGGTLNAAIFDSGVLKESFAMDIGGRLVRVNEELVVTYISDRISFIIEEKNIAIKLGEIVELEALESLCECLADSCLQACGLKEMTLETKQLYITDVFAPNDIDYISVSGGIGEYVGYRYEPRDASTLFTQICANKINKVISLETDLESDLEPNLVSSLVSDLVSNLEPDLVSDLEPNLESNLELNLESNLVSNLKSNLVSNLKSNLVSNLKSNLVSKLVPNLESNLESNLIATKTLATAADAVPDIKTDNTRIDKKTLDEVLNFGDIGPLLGRKITEAFVPYKDKLIIPEERIRATVIGAGNHALSISGSTIGFDETILPIKNIPIIKSPTTPERWSLFYKETKPIMEMYEEEILAVSIKGKISPSYIDLKILAEQIAQLYADNLSPIIVLLQEDFAKALSQMIRIHANCKKPIICLDKIHSENGDYIDIGTPVGSAVPVIIKTLIYHS